MELIQGCGGLCTHRSQVMFTNRKERAELLEGLVVSNKDATVPVLPQVRTVSFGLATAPVDDDPYGAAADRQHAIIS